MPAAVALAEAGWAELNPNLNLSYLLESPPTDPYLSWDHPVSSQLLAYAETRYPPAWLLAAAELAADPLRAAGLLLLLSSRTQPKGRESHLLDPRLWTASCDPLELLLHLLLPALPPCYHPVALLLS